MKNELIKFMTFYAKQSGIDGIGSPEQFAKDWVSDYMESIPKVDESGTPSSMTIFSNGNVMVFDNKGEQMGELQESTDNLFFEFLELKGIDPTKIKKIKKTVNGKNRLVKPFKTEDGNWNKHFEDDNG